MTKIERTEYPGNVTRLLRWRQWRVALTWNELPWRFAWNLGWVPHELFVLYWGHWVFRVAKAWQRPPELAEVFVPEAAADGL